MTLAEKIKNWRGKRNLKEAAAELGIDYPSFRKYAAGKRTPGKLALMEIGRRMEEK